MNTVVIGFGSNIDPDKNIPLAKQLLNQKYPILAESQFLKTKPIGGAAQPDFINGAVLVHTSQEYDELKSCLRDIEASLGRGIHHSKNEPRTIDLDIVVWNGKVVNADFHTRDFVKKAVLEILPNVI